MLLRGNGGAASRSRRFSTWVFDLQANGFKGVVEAAVTVAVLGG